MQTLLDTLGRFFGGLNAVDAIVAGVLLFSLLLGLFRGFFSQLSGLIGVGIALWLAFRLNPLARDLLTRVKELPEATAMAVSFTLVFLFLWFLWLGLMRLLKGLLRALHFGSLDRILGAAFGLLKGALVAYLLLVLLERFPLFAGVREALRQARARAGMALVDELLLKNRERIPPEAWKVIAELRRFPQRPASP